MLPTVDCPCGYTGYWTVKQLSRGVDLLCTCGRSIRDPIYKLKPDDITMAIIIYETFLSYDDNSFEDDEDTFDGDEE